MKTQTIVGFIILALFVAAGIAVFYAAPKRRRKRRLTTRALPQGYVKICNGVYVDKDVHHITDTSTGNNYGTFSGGVVYGFNDHNSAFDKCRSQGNAPISANAAVARQF